MSATREAPDAIRPHHTEAAPAAIGPYSQAVSFGDLLFTSGQIALDPASGALATGGLEAEARQVFRNLGAVLAASGCGFVDVLKATVYLVDMADFPALNAIYAEVFGGHKPARSTVAVAALPKGARVEIDLVARRR